MRLLLLIWLLIKGGRKWKNLKFLMAEMNPTSLGFVTIQMDMFSIAVAAHLRAILFSTARSVARFKITTTWRARAVLLIANTSRYAPNHRRASRVCAHKRWTPGWLFQRQVPYMQPLKSCATNSLIGVTVLTGRDLNSNVRTSKEEQ